jgi:hypothetical protein
MPSTKSRVAKSGASVDAKVKSAQSASAEVATPESLDAPTQPTGRAWMHLCAVALLILLAAQLFFSARNKSATMDEPNHIARGLVYLRTGDLRLSKEHPPLINLICALPLVFDKSITLPLEDPSWDKGDWYSFAEQLLWKTNDNGPSMVARARVPIMALTLLLGAIIYLWAYEFYGAGAALLVLALVVMDPNLVANGQLATNDLGVTFFSTLSLFTFWRFLRSPNWRRALVTGISLGLALTAKFSAIFLIQVLPLAALTFWLSKDAGERPPLNIRAILKFLALIGLASWLTLWTVYGFQIGNSRSLGMTVAAPAYFDGIRAFKTEIDQSSPTFLLGNYSTEGWWYYFPVAFALKTPLPTILLFLASLVYAARKTRWRKGLIFLVPAVAYFMICIYSGFNIGYRHLLPVLPLLFLFIGQLATVDWRPHQLWVWLAAPIILWLLVGTVRIFPHYLAYFNELAGGPAAGYTKLVDSNLDWGQDLPGLRQYMERQNIESVKLSYFGSAFPEAYGVRYEPLPSFPRYSEVSQRQLNLLQHPPTGVYAISATNLQGVLFRNNYRYMYSWFRARKPDAMIGYSIFIYRVE